MGLFTMFLCLALGGFASAADGLHISWTNNLLTVSGENLPGQTMSVWYLEAFCRRGSTAREWGQTTRPHKTTLLAASPDGQGLKFRTLIEPQVELRHEISAGTDELDIQFTFTNHGTNDVDLEWFQPACIRVEKFTGCVQSNYTGRSFIFTERGLTLLAATRRTEEARYRGGQVYVPVEINLADVNPRPPSLDRPVNGLIGCFSADHRWLLATASDRTQELFEGVYVCLHSDPRVGGLKAGEVKKLRSKIYFLKNDPDALLARYRKDFPGK